MATPVTRIIVNGAGGRTASRICALASRDESFALVAALTHARSRHIGRPAADTRDGKKPLEIQAHTDSVADVVIDFSSDAGARDALALALEHSAALLVGTTALRDETVSMLRAATLKISVLVAPNTSLGVVAVAHAASALAGALGPSYTASIVETHHTKKKDAPSGTALRLAGAIRQGGGSLADSHIFSIRAGDVVGEHAIRFTGEGETIELNHRAMSRDVFALGALRAAAWLRGRPPGWRTMEDVLGFEQGGR